LVRVEEDIVEERGDDVGKHAEDAQHSCQHDGLYRMKADKAVAPLVEIDEQAGDPPEQVAESCGGVRRYGNRCRSPGRGCLERCMRGLRESRCWVAARTHPRLLRHRAPTAWHRRHSRGSLSAQRMAL